MLKMILILAIGSISDGPGRCETPRSIFDMGMRRVCGSAAGDEF